MSTPNVSPPHRHTSQGLDVPAVQAAPKVHWGSRRPPPALMWGSDAQSPACTRPGGGGTWGWDRVKLYV